MPGINSKAPIVDSIGAFFCESHGSELRAGMVRTAKDWPWGSYRANAGLVTVPDWLQVDWLLSCFAKRKSHAMESYRRFVSESKDLSSPLGNTRNQIYLGDKAFVEDMQSKVDFDADLSEVTSAQRRRVADPVISYLWKASTRNEGIYQAYRSGGYSMKAISEEVGLHYSTVSKIIHSYEKSRFKT